MRMWHGEVDDEYGESCGNSSEGQHGKLKRLPADEGIKHLGHLATGNMLNPSPYQRKYRATDRRTTVDDTKSEPRSFR